MSKNGKFLVVFGVIALIGLFGAASVAVQIYESGFWRGPDAKFGDQHLKTSVALLELHKSRNGRYPRSLRDLKFLGDWDLIHVNAVSYRVDDSGSKYCVTVERGWMGKPELEMPDEFWRGTGYDPSLCK